MFDQLFEGVRKASESSMQMQQELFKYWTQQLSPPPSSAGASADWGRTAQKRWLGLAMEMLNRHRETMDAMYRAGIQIIEQTFHVSEAKSSDDYRRMVEELWRKLFDTMKTQAESQFHDFQRWSEKSVGIIQDGRVQ